MLAGTPDAPELYIPYSQLSSRNLYFTIRSNGDPLALAPQIPVRTEVQTYPLERANEALADLPSPRLIAGSLYLAGQVLALQAGVQAQAN